MKPKRKRYKVVNTITTVNGTLYSKEAVFFENVEDNGDYRVKDTMGKMKNFFDVMEEFTQFIVGSEPEKIEVKEKQRIGFKPVKEKRKYTKRKKK